MKEYFEINSFLVAKYIKKSNRMGKNILKYKNNARSEVLSCKKKGYILY